MFNIFNGINYKIQKLETELNWVKKGVRKQDYTSQEIDSLIKKVDSSATKKMKMEDLKKLARLSTMLEEVKENYVENSNLSHSDICIWVCFRRTCMYDIKTHVENNLNMILDIKGDK